MTILKTEKTIRAYNKNADKYTAKFQDFSTYKRKITEFQNQHISKGAKILDLGCGPGNNITTIKSLDDTCQFTGVDLSVDLLNIAKKIHPNCRFINQDICKLKVTEQYDTILASFCIVHLVDRQTVNLVKYISESLVERGCLYMSFMEGTSSGFESTSFSKDEIFFNYYQPDDILELLKSCNLELKSLSREGYLEQDGSTTNDVFIYATKQ